MLDEAKEARANLKKFFREVMMGGRNNTTEAREPLHSYPRGPRGGTGAGRDQDGHPYPDLGGEADLRSYLVDGLWLTEKPHQKDPSDPIKLLP
jgi:hypothetical protein